MYLQNIMSIHSLLIDLQHKALDLEIIIFSNQAILINLLLY